MEVDDADLSHSSGEAGVMGTESWMGAGGCDEIGFDGHL